MKSQVAVLTLDNDFINEIKGTFAMIKWIAASTGALFLLLLGTAITLHQADVLAAYEVANRVSRIESKSLPSIVRSSNWTSLKRRWKNRVLRFFEPP